MPEEEQQQLRRQLDALTDAVAELRRRVEVLEQSLAKRETAAVPPPPLWPAPPPPASGSPESPRSAPADAAAAVGEKAEEAELESSLGLVWLNRAGVLTLVLGVAFLFRYAVDNAWIGARARVAIGAAAGIAALACGEALWQRGQRIFSMGILALGLCLLYVSLYAAHGFYQLASAPATFAAMALVTAAGAWLAVRHEAQPVMVLTLAGGFLTPLVLDTGRDAPWVLFPWLLLLDAGAAWTGLRRAWRATPVAAAGASIWVFSWWLFSRFEAAARAPALFFVLGVYAVFLLVPLPVLRGLLQLFAGLGLAGIWQQEAARLLAWLLPVTVAGLWRVSPAFVWAGFWMAWWLSAPGSGAPLAVRLGGAAAGFAAISLWLIRSCRQDRADTAPGDLAVLSANALAMAAAGYSELQPAHGASAGPFLFALAAVHAGAAWLVRRREDAVQVCALLAAVFLTLAIPAQFGGWRVGVAWATEAALLGWLARRFRAGRLEWLAVAVLLTALVRVAVWDAPGGRPLLLLNAPFFTMLWTALACWASAVFYGSRIASAVAWLAGHLMMWGALELEALAEVRRSAAPESVRSAEIAVFSLVLAAYGVALVAVGMARRAAADRAAGLAALVLTLVKLYAYDVWQLGRLFRTAAFLGLGVLLVAASWLYSRRRERVARLLRLDR
jgi:uncharacterized membrane protein